MAGECGHDHRHHEHKPGELGIAYTLFTKIDLTKVQCLNESREDSGKLVFKAWHERCLWNLNVPIDSPIWVVGAVHLSAVITHRWSVFVESDCDEELLFNIPFTGSVKLKGIIVVGGEDSYHPSKMRIFKNRPNMTFDDASAPADQEFDLQPDHEGTLEYIPKIARFSNTEYLSIHFPTNFGEETTKVYYIGLKGDFMEAHKHGVTICNYEAKANPSDHKASDFNPSSHTVQ